MKWTCVLVVWLSVSLPARGLAQDPPPEALPEPGAVRAMDPPATEALAYGRRGSEAFRAVLEELDAATIVVHVVTGDTVLFGTSGTTRLVGTRSGWRYLRVVLSPRLPVAERASMLAHELQHVREIARSAATTQDHVRALYTDIGRPVPGEHDAFETAAAADTGLRVWRELRAADRQARRMARLSSQEQ